MAEKGYTIGKQIATSTASPGVVFYEGRKDGLKVAIKMMEESKMDRNIVAMELLIMKRLSNRNIVKYLDQFKLKPDNKFQVVVQEWLTESLRERVLARTRAPMTASDVKYTDFELLPSGVDLRTVRIWMGQLGQAIEYIHNKGYVHNRIDPDSVMVRSAYRVVLSHFLCVTPYHGKNENNPAPFKNVKYMSPELVNAFMSDVPLDWDAKENDVWGFGATCAFAVSGSDLFDEPDPDPESMVGQHDNVLALINGVANIHGVHNLFLKQILGPGRKRVIAEVLKLDWFEDIRKLPADSPPPKSPVLGQIVTGNLSILEHYDDHFKSGIEKFKKNHNKQLEIKSKFHAFLKSEYLSFFAYF